MTMRDLRRNYDMKALEREDLAGHPVNQFHKWFEEARDASPPDWLELNAMTLATYDPDQQQVTARIVLLKHLDERGFMFFTNYLSDKGTQLSLHHQASLVFYWPHMERQVRVLGRVSKTDRQTSEHYFHSRPRTSQLGAAASQQSKVIESREVLQAEVARLDKLYQDQQVPCPDHWGGLLLQPYEIEFWQGRLDRLHDRFAYRKTGEAWTIVRLSP